MSNGGEENLKDSQKTESSKKRDVFVQFIARVAVAQICGSLGFQGFQQSALDTLSDVVVRYIRQIGKVACLSANSAGRRECNVFDVIRAFEDLGSVQGFSAASDVHRCLMGSGMVKDVVSYVAEAEEIPFPFALPEFPVRKERKLNLSFMQCGENPPGGHIPVWLPVFPDPETYDDRKSRSEKEGEGKVERLTDQVDEPRVDRSALSSQHQLASNGLIAASTINLGDVAKAKQPAERNLFLLPPLQFEEKEVSLVVRPTKLTEEAAVHPQNHIVESNNGSVLEAFAPAVEAISSAQHDTEEVRQRVIPDRRPSVHFKLGSSRKISCTPLLDQNEGFQSIPSWSRKDNGKDEKERRAEEILKQSMENSEELVHHL